MNETPRRDQATSSRSETLFLFQAPPRVTFVQLKEPLNELEEDAGDPSLLFWVLGLLFFGLGDTFSSFLAFSAGAVEANPVMDFAMTLPGALMGFVVFKTVALLVLYGVCYLWDGFHRWMIPLLMTAAGVYLTVNNILVYLEMR